MTAFAAAIKDSEKRLSGSAFNGRDYVDYLNCYRSSVNRFRRALKNEGLTSENADACRFFEDNRPNLTHWHLDFINRILQGEATTVLSGCPSLESKAELIKSEMTAFSKAEAAFNALARSVAELRLFSEVSKAIDSDSDLSRYYDPANVDGIVNGLAKSAKVSVKTFVLNFEPDEIIHQMQTVVDWMKKTYPVYLREMKQADLIGLHDKYGDESIDSVKVEKELSKRNTIDPDKDFEIIIKRCVKKKSA